MDTNELLRNLQKIHTTEMGIQRIKKNLSLDTTDAIEWCKKKILSPLAKISRKGKNYYVTINDCLITVNAYSYTIITAHKIKNCWFLKNLPEEIKKFLECNDYQLDQIGQSESRVLLFDEMILKISPKNSDSDNEIIMLQYLNQKINVPKIITTINTKDINYLLMEKIKGQMACDDSYLSDFEELVSLIVDTLQKLWSIEINDCPSNCQLAWKLKQAQANIEQNKVDMNNCQAETFGENGFKNPMELLEYLKNNQPEEDLVFSHGDLCLPNMIVDGQKKVYLIDLGKAGVADRYQDIALVYRSLKNNLEGLYGNKIYQNYYLNLLFEKLGLEPDWEKINYYILLDELF